VATTSARLYKRILRFYEGFSNLFKNKIKKIEKRNLLVLLNGGEMGISFHFEFIIKNL